MQKKNLIGCLVLSLVTTAIAVGQTNTLPENGSVGIGTTTPAAPLHIVAGNDGASGQTNCGVESANCPISSASGYGIILDSDYSSGQFRWRFEPIDRGNNISLYFQETGSTPNSYSNIVRFGFNQFDSNSFAVFGNTYLGGNVGIGTTSPSYTLDVDGSIRAAMAPAGYSSWSGDYNAQYGISLSADGNNAGIFGRQRIASGSPTYTDMIFYAGNDGDERFQFYPGVWTGTGNYLGDEAMDLNAYTGLLYVKGSVGIGTKSPSFNLDVAGTIRATGTINAQAGVVYPDGNTQTTAWTGVLCGGDYAESVDVVGSRTKYEPGDVLVVAANDSNDVERSSEPYSTLVSGVYATKPGVTGRRQSHEKSETEVPMAMIGIVPTKVSAENGPIHKGDLLVSSSTQGYAMKGTDRSRMLGAVIGKALGTIDTGTGMIEVLITLQ